MIGMGICFRSKGQFFILGGILIVLAIYLLSGTLQSGKSDDPSFVQDNEALWLVHETDKGLYHIVRDNLTDNSNIIEYMRVQSEIAQGYGYSLDFRFDSAFNSYSTSYPNVYTIIVKSSDFYIERKEKVLPYYWICKEAEYASVCDGLDILLTGYRAGCCHAHDLCC